MKKAALFMAAMAIVVLTGCTSVVPRGGISTDAVLPIQATNGPLGKKIGKASCVSWFGMVLTGDASIATAARKGGITKISHVDWKVVSDIPVGIKTVYTTTVYGD